MDNSSMGVNGCLSVLILGLSGPSQGDGMGGLFRKSFGGDLNMSSDLHEPIMSDSAYSLSSKGTFCAKTR